MSDWRAKFRKLIREAAEEIGVERPRLVVPKRVSGPRILPDGWHTEEMQRRLCVLCSLPIVGRMTLHEGRFCGPCFHFRVLPGRKAQPDLPPAA